MVQKVEISPKTIVFTVFFLLSLYLVYFFRDVLAGLFVSVLLTTALNPIVTKLEEYRIPRPVGILLMYILLITFLAFTIGIIVPPLVTQTNNLLDTLPIESLSKKFAPIEVNLESLQLIASQWGSFAQVGKVVTGAFSAVITFFTFLVITFYMLMERKNLHKHLVFIFGKDAEEGKAENFLSEVDKQIGGWVRGEFTLMVVIGVLTYIGLTLLGIPYALALAIIAGVLELVPNIGPIISAIPTIIIAAMSTQNPVMALFVAVLYLLVQQLENNFIVPKVMQSAVGIHPLVTILLIVIGLKLMGIPGAILAVPVYLVIKVFYKELKPHVKIF